MNSHTFTSNGGDFSERVITAITLATYDPSFTGALPGDGVAGPRLGAYRETFTGVAGVLPLWTVVVFLQGEKTVSKYRIGCICTSNQETISLTNIQDYI